MVVYRDAVGGTSGRSWRYVGTRPERAEAPSPGQRPGLGASALSGRMASSKYMINEGGMHVIRDKDARDSGQLLFFREKCCIFALSFKDRLN